jgi:sirohydrochlorin cobaltochelatase
VPLDAAQVALDRLDARLRILLPEQYQETYESLEPVPMRSAGLKLDAEGLVAWDEIWQSFCDLAMAGGPPHKGAWLAPGTAEQIAAEPDKYDTVAAEICRGIWMAADLPAQADRSGWIRVHCHSATMAGWLLRAIVMENVAARASGVMLFLPAAPHFRLEKEIKNVVTVIAKTAHYWMGHVSRSQKALIADLFLAMSAESPLIEPGPDAPASTGWRGIPCADVRAAVWMTRALVAFNILARRENVTLFVPVDHDHDPDGVIVAAAVERARTLEALRRTTPAP